MAAKFKIGDIVWAKLKSFPTWPAKVVQPKAEVKRPANKKAQQFVFFFGSDNFAWVLEDQIWPYVECKNKFTQISRVPRGFKEAIEATDEAVKALPQGTKKDAELLSIDNELDIISTKNKAARKRKEPPLPQAPGKPKVERTPGSTEKRGRPKKTDQLRTNEEYDYERMRGRRLLQRRSDKERAEAVKMCKPKPAKKQTPKQTQKKVVRTITKSVKQTRDSRQSCSNIHAMIAQQCELSSASSSTSKQRTTTDHYVMLDDNSDTDCDTAMPSCNGGDLNAKNVDNVDAVEGSEVVDDEGELDESTCNIPVNANFENSLSIEEEVRLVVQAMVSKVVGDEEPDVCDRNAGDNLVCDKTNNNEKINGKCDQPQSENQKSGHKSLAKTVSADSAEENVLGQDEWLAIVHGHSRPSTSDTTADESTEISMSPPGGSVQSNGLPCHKQTQRIQAPAKPSPANRRSMLKRASTPPLGTSSAKKTRTLVKSMESPNKRDMFNAASASAADEAKASTTMTSPAIGDAAPRNIIPTPMKIGFLGLGIMGSGMVFNLLKSGHEVTVWNRTSAKCREFVSQGALRGDCPAEVVASCDITFSCVSDPTALRDLVFGTAGVLQGIGPGRSYVDMSTVDIDTILDVSQSVNSRGGRFLEASVCGSKEPASRGELIIVASGDEELFDDCYSCFEAMGKKSFYLGEVGSATKLTLVHNMLMGTMVAALAESIALADSVNVDLNVLQHIFDISPSLTSIIQNKTYAILGSDFEPNFSIQHQQKDLRLAIDMGDLYDQSFPVAAAANELFKKAKAKGYKENDIAAVYRAAAL